MHCCLFLAWLNLRQFQENMLAYLSDALKREAINSPAIPGRLLNISSTIKGIICTQKYKIKRYSELVCCLRPN